jgi:hydrogenase/urease accessory protein HupE
MRSYLWLFALLALPAPAYAHQSSLTYLDVAVRAHGVEVAVEISNRDLYEAVGAEKDRPVTRDEALRARDRLLAYVGEHVRVENGGSPCAAHTRELSFADKSDGFFAIARIDYECKRAAESLVIRYDLFFDLDPAHQGLAHVSLPDAPEWQHIFKASARELRLDQPVTLWQHLADYFVLGIEHIFTGYDHLSFLVGLLLAAATRARPRGLRSGVAHVFGIVTAFTVAHTLTLIAAALGVVRLPAAFVEPAIALSIAYVAVENLAVDEPRNRWLLTFFFGLVHGFGFASVLAEIGLPASGIVPSLVAFNLGVEVGQLCVVTALAPLLLWVLPRYGQSQRVRTVVSVILLALSTLWLFERVTGKVWLGGMLG